MKHAILCIALVGMTLGMHAQHFSEKIFTFDFSKVESGKDLIATFGEPKELSLDGDAENWIFEAENERLFVAVKAGKVANYRYSQAKKEHTLREQLGAAEVLDFRGLHIEKLTRELGPPTEISVGPNQERWTFRSEDQMLSLSLDSKTRTVKNLRFSSRN